MAVTRLTLRLQEQLLVEINQIVDQRTHEIAKAWVDAFDEVAPDLHAALYAELSVGEFTARTQLRRSERLAAALAQIFAALQDITRQAGIDLTTDLTAVVNTTAAAQAGIIGSQLPEGSELAAAIGAAAAPDHALTAIVHRSTRQITSRLRPLAPTTYQAMRRELIRGVAAGSNPRQTAARMVRRAQDRSNFGLARAQVIARTETLDAHRAAAQVTQAQQVEVLAGWVWLAKLDGRTCRSCWAQAGHLHPLDDPGPLDHPQGRCARMPQTKSWRELGFHIPEPPTALPDTEAEFARLPVHSQRQILGVRGHELWQRGEFPMDSWSQRKDNPDWRPAYVTAAPPAAS